MRLGTVLAIALVLAGCTPTTDPHRDKAIASKAIDAFHRQIEAGRFAALYGSMNATAKITMSQPQFDALAGTLRGIGPFRDSAVTRWYAYDVWSGTFIHLLVASTHPRGTATELFIFHREGDGADLREYRVRVNAMVPSRPH